MIISNQPKEIKAKPCISSIPQELHIINLEEVVYHQGVALHIIKPTEIHTCRCDEIQHGYAVLMIYTLTRDDIPSLSAWIKKSDKSKLVGFFGRDGRIRTYECNSQSVVSYRLTTPLKKYKKNGVDNRIRTGDLQGHNLAL